MEKSKRQLGVKIMHLQSSLQVERRECRQLRQKIKELLESRNHQRSKVKMLRAELKKRVTCGHPVLQVPDAAGIAGHKYDLRTVSLCVCLYVFAGCSLRGVSKVLFYLQLEYGLLISCLPSKSSVENWVQKVGLYNYTEVKPDFGADYCLILDESMVIGHQRMLLALGTRGKKSGDDALCFEEVKVLGIAVRASWKWEEVRDFLQKVHEKVGQPAGYVVCDGGANLKKGVAEAGLTRICDVGHEFCKITEQVYKEDERFKEWIKEVTKVRFQVFMKAHAYLMPPKQRTVARFTNLSFVVKWAGNMLRVLPGLNEAERGAFGWLELHKPLISEFTAVFQMNERILKILKNQGVSVKNIERCLLICQEYAPMTPKCLINKIVSFLNEEKQKLPDDNTVWNASSDILESLFGKYKHQTAENVLNGVTPLVLALCVFTGMGDGQKDIHQQVKSALESISMADLNTWKTKNLVDNQLTKRRKMFQK